MGSTNTLSSTRPWSGSGFRNGCKLNNALCRGAAVRHTDDAGADADVRADLDAAEDGCAGGRETVSIGAADRAGGDGDARPRSQSSLFAVESRLEAADVRDAVGVRACRLFVEFGLQVLFPDFVVIVSVGELQNFWNRKHMFKLDIAGNAIFFLHGLRDFDELGNCSFVVANGNVPSVASPERD